MLRRLLPVTAIAVAVAAASAPAASAAADPTVAWADGAVRVTGTPGADAFTLAAGDATHVVIDSATAFAASDDGVCATLGTEATCEFDFDPSAPHAPADVVFDLSATGADSVDASGRGAAVRSVAVTYAGAPSALSYAGGTPARATVGGETDTLTGVERIVGTPFADTFIGGPAAETLAGRDGDDTFDLTRAGGPADTVDCGAGKDGLAYRAGTDTQTGCEVLNGIDTTYTPPPSPPVLVPSQPPISQPAPPIVLPQPTFQAPTRVTGSTIDVTVTCAASCAGQVATVLPPPVGPPGLPLGWPSQISGSSLSTLLSLLAAGQDPAKVDAALLAALRQLQTALGQQAQNALSQAMIEQQRASTEAILAIAQALLASLGNTTNLGAAAALTHDVGKAENRVKTPLNGGVKQTPQSRARAAKARRPTARALGRWLLLRTAQALPAIHPKLTATAKPGVYRARITAPLWLRATSRVLRHRGVRTLPVRIVLGRTTASLRLPLPR